MSNLYLKFECFGGSDIRNAIEDLCIIASRVGCTCTAKMNDVNVMAKPGSDPRDVYEKWKAELETKHQYKVVCGQPAQIPRNERWDERPPPSTE